LLVNGNGTGNGHGNGTGNGNIERTSHLNIWPSGHQAVDVVPWVSLVPLVPAVPTSRQPP
jgi:hypothetical protein